MFFNWLEMIGSIERAKQVTPHSDSSGQEPLFKSSYVYTQSSGY